MKIALFGSTRGTGRHVLEQALARGHHVVALARDPASLPTHERLTAVKGDARNLADVEKVVGGANAVISCIGNTTFKKVEYMVSTAAKPLIEAMEKHAVKRLVLLSVQGAGDGAPWLLRNLGFPLMRLLAKNAYAVIFEDKDRAEELVRGSSLDWTLVRAPGLNDKPAQGNYRVLERGGNPLKQITRADLATFMLDEAEQNRWILRTPVPIN
jgi:putative NADH-flavin reductase